MFREGRLAFLALPPDAPEALLPTMKSVLDENGLQTFSRTTPTSGEEWSDPVQGALRDADVIIADVTGKNANVLFEVGLAIGLGKPVLLLSQGALDDLPSDLRAYQVASYRPQQLNTVQRYLALWLRDTLAEKRSSAAY